MADCEHKNTKNGKLKGLTEYEFCIDCGMSRAGGQPIDIAWELNPYGLQQEYMELSRSKGPTEKIIIKPDEWDAGVNDYCPFGDGDDYCGLVYTSGGDVKQCEFPLHVTGERCECPLKANGPVEINISLALPEKPEQVKLFYVQNPQLTHGGFVHLWTINNHGYRPDVSKARQFTEGEIKEMFSINSGQKYAWPKDYIDERVVDRMVQASQCDLKVAVAAAAL